MLTAIFVVTASMSQLWLTVAVWFSFLPERKRKQKNRSPVSLTAATSQAFDQAYFEVIERIVLPATILSGSLWLFIIEPLRMGSGLFLVCVALGIILAFGIRPGVRSRVFGVPSKTNLILDPFVAVLSVFVSKRIEPS